MRAGALTERISIIEPTITKDDFGASNLTWTTKYDPVYAHAIQDGGNRTNENNEIVNNYTVTFEVRLHLDIDENMMVVWGDDTYRILAIFRDNIAAKQIIRTELKNE